MVRFLSFTWLIVLTDPLLLSRAVSEIAELYRIQYLLSKQTSKMLKSISSSKPLGPGNGHSIK